MVEVAPEPFFFGDARSQRFGCFHPPAPAAVRDTAVVLCQPFGHEYIRAHRAFRRLAARLASLGFPVLRFDFSGCGDSSGGEELARLDVWIDDVHAAVRAVFDRARWCSSLCLAGGRLGASLAAMASARDGQTAGLVLWDPVVNGADHLRHLQESHREMLASAHVVVRGAAAPEEAHEALGFLLAPALRRGLEEELDLLRSTSIRAAAVLLLDSTGAPACAALGARLAASGRRVELLQTAGEQPWAWAEDVARAVLPVPAIESIVSWVHRTCR